MSNYALYTLCANINKKSLLHAFQQHFFIEKGKDQKKGRHLLKVHISTEFYMPQCTLYLYFNKTTHQYLLKCYIITHKTPNYASKIITRPNKIMR